MAEHAEPVRKSAGPAAAATRGAEAGSEPYAALLDRRSKATLSPATQLLDRRAAAAEASAPRAPTRAITPKPIQPTAQPNRTGLPDRLKAGLEALSGLAMDDVRVHRNSSEPAKLGALAYAQGGDIHLGPGQEQHLPHEAWHVVQQKQGRVDPTLQLKVGIPVNDDPSLEHEADVMGARAARQEGAAEEAALEVNPHDFDKPKRPGTAAPLQGEFVSIAEARRAAGDAGEKESLRIKAETYLKEADRLAADVLRALVERGELDEALAKATVLAGLPAGRYQVRSTADYATVVHGAEIPRGKPSGVTVMEQGLPVVYILEDNIREWVNGGDIGNLLATIRHEATHADQSVRQNGPSGEAEREFEAYAAEIIHVQEIFAAGEDPLMPSSAHLAASYSAANSHYDELPAPVPQHLQATKAKVDAQYPTLKRFLEENDLESGRVGRIQSTIRTALRTYIDNPETPYPRLAYNDYLKIPERFREKLDDEFIPLIDQAVDINRDQLTRRV